MKRKEKEDKQEIIDISQEDLKQSEETIDSSNDKQKETDQNETAEDLPKKKLKDRLTSRLGIAILLTAIVLAIIVFVIFIILHLSSSKGLRTARSISKFIGETTKVCENKLEISLKQESSFDVLNNAVDFDRVYEDKEKTVNADGITYPAWAVFIKTDSMGNILTVRLADFQTIEKNLQGEKKKAPINLEKFDKDATMASVQDEINLDPYSITYNSIGAKYVYKYHYTKANGDNQAVILTVKFTAKGKFDGYESKLIYPENL